MAKRSGAFNYIMRSGFRNDRLLVLAYHGVSISDEHEWNPSLFVSETFLRRRFELLRDSNCTVLPLGEALERLYSNSLPKRAVAITFDDGGYNFYEKAYPLIEEFELPATVYLTTFYSLYNKPVFPVAANYLLWKGRSQTIDLRSLIGTKNTFSLSDEGQRNSAHKSIVQYADGNLLSAEAKNDLLSAVAEQLAIDFTGFVRDRTMSLMNQDEVADISASHIDVQLHTHRHRVPYERDLFLREIRENSAIIETVTGKRPSHLCYPSGEYSPKLFPWLREAGIASATTCETALTTNATDPFLIPRLVDTMYLSEVEFEGWLAGISHFLPQRSRWAN